jgi:hypothetical protein
MTFYEASANETYSGIILGEQEAGVKNIPHGN